VDFFFRLRQTGTASRVVLDAPHGVPAILASGYIPSIEFCGEACLEIRVTRPNWISVCVLNSLLVAAVLFAHPAHSIAQRRGASDGGAGLSTYSRPDGVDERDALRDFHHVLAVQATSQQIAEFQAAVKITENAKTQLQAFLQQAGKEKSSGSESAAATLDQALNDARTRNTKFVAGFSDSQKDGLKDLAKRLEKADADLQQEQTKLKQSLQSAAPTEVVARVETLDRALTEFSDQQLALGREMSIVIATGRDLAFTLPVVNSPVTIQHRTVAVTVSGALSQIEEQNGQRTFKLELYEDLSDLQQNIGPLLAAQLATTSPCGERLAIRQATLTPSSPASLLVLQLHYERWSCAGGGELAESDGTVEVKLTPLVDVSNTLNLTAEFGRIDASGMFADSLRSGDLGDDLRDKISLCLLPALRAAMDFNSSLPPALEKSAVIQSATFQNAGAGLLKIVLEGRTQISNAQANLLASQLNQAMAGKTASPQ